MTTSLLTDAVSSGTSSTTGGTTSPIAAASSSSSTQDMFTTLLVAQIKNQNPLEPTDSTQFINQLTQLSQTEALQKLTSQGTTNASILQSMQVIGLGAQVGSEVMAQASSIALGDSAVHGSFTLSSASTETAVVLTDTAGVQHRVELGTHGIGDVDFTLDPVSLGLPAGRYSIAVATASGESPSVEVAGKLQSVRLSSTGSVVLKVSNLGEIDPAAITRFNGQQAS